MPTKTKKPIKKMFKVLRTWEMSGWNEVEATSQEEAENLMDSDDQPLPEDSDYVGDSCRVDREVTMEFDKKKKEWVNCQN